MPSNRRPLIWALLLGCAVAWLVEIVCFSGARPLDRHSDAFIWAQRQEAFDVLHKSIRLMHPMTVDMPTIMLRMYWLQTRHVTSSSDAMPEYAMPKWRAFRCIANVMMVRSQREERQMNTNTNQNVSNDDTCTAYWLTTRFYAAVRGCDALSLPAFHVAIKKRMSNVAAYAVVDVDLLDYWWTSGAAGALEGGVVTGMLIRLRFLTSRHQANKGSSSRLWEFLIAGGPGYCQELLCSTLVEVAMRARIEHTDIGVVLRLSDEEFDDAVAVAFDHLSSRHGKFADTRPFFTRPGIA